MAWQAGMLNMIPQLPDFFGKGVDYGIGSLGGMPDSKARKNQIHDIRTLRRREYQDLVHSLKEAGLNPLLAVGASPGHASAQMLPPNLGASGSSGGVGSAVAANRSAGVAEGRLSSENAKNMASAGLMQEQAQNTLFGRAGLLQQYELNQAELDLKRQSNRTTFLLGEKYMQDAITSGASAKKLEADTHAIETFGPSGSTWPGMLRAFLGNNVSAKGLLKELNDAGQVVKGK